MENQTNLSWEKFAPKFGTWANKIKPFFDHGGFDPIYEFLKKESKRGKKIAPLSEHTFRCFTETPIDQVKVILVGMCPYHVFRKEGPVADGLLMGCSITKYPQPTLDQFYTGIENELHNGLNLHYTKNPDVSYLAHQGVLMLNAALTTEYNKAGNHLALWEPFMKYLFETVFFELGVPVIFLGKEASKLIKYTAPFTWTFVVAHPASAAYKGTEWDTEGVFGKVNSLLKQRNNETVNWLNSDEPVKEEDDDLPF